MYSNFFAFIIIHSKHANLNERVRLLTKRSGMKDLVHLY